MAELGVAPGDTVMLGDSSWDADAASAAGCRFVGVGPAPFGRGIDVASDLELALDLLGL